MSLIVVAEHVYRPRTILRVLLVTVAIIAGLLSMHALNAHATASGHATAAGHGAAVMASTPHHPGRDAIHLTPGEEVAPSAEQPMPWMACVLALLGAVIAFLVAERRRLASARARLLGAQSTRWSVVAHPLPPPSLAVLCIRRT